MASVNPFLLLQPALFGQGFRPVAGLGRTRWAGVLALLLALAGCAAPQAFREGERLFAEGKTEQGLAKMEEAVRLDPRSAEYRIGLSMRRTSLINRGVAAGQAAQREGRLSDAEKAYQQVLALDPNQAMARQGLDALVLERRHRLMVAEAEAAFKKGGESGSVDALEKLRPVLTANPAHKEANHLKARIDEQRARIAKPEARLAAVYRKPITLEFRDAPLKAVFDVISKVSGLNFFFDKDVRPDLKATVLAKNTSIEDAVRLLLVTNQLEQKVLNENSVLIYPATPQKQKDYQTLAVRSFYLANGDVKAVSNTIKTLVKTKDLVIDERLGLILMRDTPEAIRMAERIVALQDLSDPEVMLEVEVLEIKRSRLLELGIQWPSQLTLAPLVAEGAPLTLSALGDLRPSTTQANIGSLLINARKEDQDGSILANPRIRVRNKEKAKVLIGDRVPVITTTTTATGFVSEAVNYVDVGIKLEVEPTVYLDDEVGIKVNLDVSSLGPDKKSPSGSVYNQIGTRGATTVLRLKDGETQVLAGLISDEERNTANKVPGMGEMPVVGRLFGSQKDDSQRSEILLSITPRVLRSLQRPDLQAAEFEVGTETNIGAPPLRLAEAEGGEALQASGAGSGTGAARTPVLSPSARPAPAAAGASPGPASAASASSPATAVPGLAPVPAAAPAGGVPTLSWVGPAQVKAGEQFSVVLRVSSQAPLRGLPLLAAFDPQALQLVTAQEGDFFRQGGGTASFSHRVDAAQGKLFVAAVRQGAVGINGSGAVVTAVFKALKPGPARLQLLSATPEPLPASPLALPIEYSVKVLP